MFSYVVFALACVVALGIVLAVRATRRSAVPVASASTPDEADGIVSEPVPIARTVRGSEPSDDAAREHQPPDDAAREHQPPQPAESVAAPADAVLSAATQSGAALPDDAAPPDATSVAATPADEAAASEPAPEIRWTKRFARNGALDDGTRLGLIRDLGLIRAPWGVLLLVQAYDEERAAEHRRAVLTSLAAYRHLDARATFEAAQRSGDEQERAIAAGALVDLGVVRSLPV